MRIYIPSTGRANKQTTVGSLPQSILDKTFLVVPRDQYDDYHKSVGHLVDIIAPALPQGIGPTRQWCVEDCLKSNDRKVLMLDDDLVFAMRRRDQPTKFTDAQDQDIVNAIAVLEASLDDYSHVGMSTREGGNRYTEPFDFNTRLLRVLGYRTDILDENDISFERIPVMEDFYVSLSLLTDGYTNAKLNWMVQNQNGSGLQGGCSTYRDMEMQALAAHTLHAAFPDFVTVVQKETKGAWGGGVRTDVRIQWKKALQYGILGRR